MPARGFSKRAAAMLRVVAGALQAAGAATYLAGNHALNGDPRTAADMFAIACGALMLSILVRAAAANAERPQ